MYSKKGKLQIFAGNIPYLCHLSDTLFLCQVAAQTINGVLQKEKESSVCPKNPERLWLVKVQMIWHNTSWLKLYLPSESASGFVPLSL